MKNVYRFGIILIGLFFFIRHPIFSQNNNPKVEIFIIDKYKIPDTLIKYMTPIFLNSINKTDTAFINDNEIIAYEIIKDTATKYNQGKLYYIHLNKSGQNKLGELKNIPLCCGKPFIITVNRIPIYSGYFWNRVSSFGCDWITISAYSDERNEIERELPYYLFSNKYPDPRGNKILLDAFKITGRLIEN